jgi:hypothetical protein
MPHNQKFLILAHMGQRPRLTQISNRASLHERSKPQFYVANRTCSGVSMTAERKPTRRAAAQIPAQRAPEHNLAGQSQTAAKEFTPIRQAICEVITPMYLMVKISLTFIS